MTAPVFLTEDGYRVHICSTHPMSRTPFHWTAVQLATGYLVGSGRATSDEYARHDARSAIKEHKRLLEERAA